MTAPVTVPHASASMNGYIYIYVKVKVRKILTFHMQVTSLASLNGKKKTSFFYTFYKYPVETPKDLSLL